ncbi:hypothetical protein KKB06_03150 [Patescibacteria group bacterium]|nr:hypothetical protein [Patescibacteria group bacterium]
MITFILIRKIGLANINNLHQSVPDNQQVCNTIPERMSHSSGLPQNSLIFFLISQLNVIE